MTPSARARSPHPGPLPYGGEGVWLRSVVVASLALASHAPSLFAGFVWLDHGDLEARAAVAAPGSWLTLFGHGFARTGFYRPLPALSLSIDALFGGGPLPFHLHSLLAHAAVAVSLGFAADALGLSRRASLAAAAVFAVHPIGGFVAGLIAFRPELMMALALCWLVWAVKHENVKLAVGAALFGGLSKETALVLAPAFVVLLRAKPRLVAAVFGGTAIAFAMRIGFAPAWNSAPVDATVGMRLAALARGLWAMLAPYETALCDATPITGLTVGGVAALLVIAAALVRRPVGLLFVASLLPALNLVPAPRFWSLHYFYLPLALGLLVVAHRWLLPLVVVLLGLSLYDARRFRSDETLWATDCREGALYRGDALRSAGRLDEAAAAYQQAVRHEPGVVSFSDETAAFQNLGLTRLMQGRLDEAEGAFEQALARQKDPVERRRLNHDLASVAFARRDFAAVERRLAPEASRADAFPESIELLRRARAAAQSPPP